jgi:hydroxymethyl cephem carbamoyltransferase
MACERSSSASRPGKRELGCAPYGKCVRIFEAMERLGGDPDVIAVGGQEKEGWWYHGANPVVETGYRGAHAVGWRDGRFGSKRVTFFSSSHECSHIMGAAGMAPRDDAPLRAVLVWEGAIGAFYLLDEHWTVVREIPVMPFPGARYQFVFALADPFFGDWVVDPGGDVAGKLMALAGFADPSDAGSSVSEAVERILSSTYGQTKGQYSDVPFYNTGVEAPVAKVAAALIQQRMFEIFADAAAKHIPKDIPLHIAGGCGLNCDWSTMWRELGHFSSVFVPPCPNDSGSAIGTVIDAIHAMTGDPHISWDVYCGLEFEQDCEPTSEKWAKRPMDDAKLADALASGRVVAWVQGRWELGPRALGNRSLLASPFDSRIRDRLNEIKLREGYRPIAPVCRIEDAARVFDTEFHDPHMLHFRRVTTPDVPAVIHVDGSARAQTVTKESNRRLHDLLTVFSERHGVGVLCNTSLNYKQLGFINRMSDLVHYCETQQVSDMVVGDAWYQRVEAPVSVAGRARRPVELQRETVA